MPNDVKTIAVLKGDYIGPEIMQAGLAVLKAVTTHQNFKYQLIPVPFGGEAIDQGPPPFTPTYPSCL